MELESRKVANWGAKGDRVAIEKCKRRSYCQSRKFEPHCKDLDEIWLRVSTSWTRDNNEFL